MALFGAKKKTDQKKAKQEVAAAPIIHREKNAATIIRSPRITEKASMVAEKNVYVFNVSIEATKKNVASGIEARYNVRPRRVRLVSVRGKKVFSRGKQGVRAGGKKAYVYLAAGETIQLT